MLSRPLQVNYFLFEILSWIIGGGYAVGLVLFEITVYLKITVGTTKFKYVPKSRRNQVSYKMYLWLYFSAFPFLTSAIDYLSQKVIKYKNKLNLLISSTSNPSKRTPSERVSISQRSKKLKSRFFYRRTKRKNAQVCYTGPVKCPDKLLRQVAAKRRYPTPSDAWLCRAINSPNFREPALSEQDNRKGNFRKFWSRRSICEMLEAVARATRPDVDTRCRYILERLHLIKLVTQPDLSAFINTPDVATFVAFPAAPETKKVREPINLDSDSYVIAVDNCCTTSITNDLKDFISPPKTVNQFVSGMGGRVLAIKKGTVRWRIEDDDGKVHVITLPGTLYAENAPFRLLSPQHWSQQANDNHPLPRGTWCATYADSVMLQWGQRRFTRTITYCPRSNVGKFRSAPGVRTYGAYANVIERLQPQPTAFPFVVSDDESSDAERESGESDDESLDPQQQGTRDKSNESEYIPDSTEPQTPNLFELNFGQGEQPDIVEPDEDAESDETTENDMLRMHYRLNHMSFNKMKVLASLKVLPTSFTTSKTPKCAACLFGHSTRRAWRTKGKSKKKLMTATVPGQCVSVDQMESPTPGFVAQMKGALTKGRYKYATIYVDHFSRASFVYLQRTLTSAETLESKRAFERHAKQHGISIRHYHADNGRFADNMFRNDVMEKNQSISYCGVNAHWQNGIAEKKIRDLTEQARTILLFAQNRWPVAISTNLWPYALRSANDSLNHAPRLLDKVIPIEAFTGAQSPMRIRLQHTFGCPTYALNNKLQGGKSIPKWQERARVGIYLGLSPQHSRSVALVLSLTTGLVSPQFHVEFDDLFETVGKRAGNPVTVSKWQVLSGLREGGAPIDKNITVSEGARPVSAPVASAYIPPSELEAFPDDDFQPPVEPEVVPNEPAPVEQPRRSTRTHQPTRRFLEGLGQEDIALAFQCDESMDYELGLQEAMADPIAFAASSDPDNLYLHEAMREPDKKQFQEAMKKEVTSHEENEHWELMKRSKIPKPHKVLPAVWAMKRKRRIATREVYKWKARLNIHGGKQEKGVNYWETYSPMVTWNSIRIFLILAIVNDWHTRQIDFVLAYPQADVECDMYMEIPRGFQLPAGGNPKDYALKLRRNLYGAKQASRVWAQYLTKGLIARGFVQSKIDECVYYRGDMILLAYVDDCIIISPNNDDIDDIIKLMKVPCKGTRAFDVTDEGQLSDYLGVKIERKDDGTICLTQPHLIDQIISDLGLKANTKTKDLPALSSKILNRDTNGHPFREDWHYRSIIGKLNFLEKSTRPDLAYSVHQCARFSIDPKASHAQAVKQIGRYLMANRDKGLILKPDANMGLEDWVDADFCGNWDRNYAIEDPTTARSRSGYVIRYCGCPVTWRSKLQTEVALSTTEAEYVALSHSLREVIPIMNLLQEAKDKHINVHHVKPIIRCTVFEDNDGALELANVPKMRARTKHINSQYHHFRSFVSRKLISIIRCDSVDQLGDGFTKPTTLDLFVTHRKRLMGW